MPDHRSHDPNQDAADAVKQRGMDATVDLGKEPEEQKGVQQPDEPPTPYTGDASDTVNPNIEEPHEREG